MKKYLITLSVFILAGLVVYFYLSHRKTAIIEKEHCDDNLFFDNPGALDLLVIFDNDTIDIPHNSSVYYPVNSARFVNGKKHLRSFNKKTGQIINDTICQFTGLPMDYFFNPSHTTYAHWTISFLIVQSADPATLQPNGPKQGMLQSENSLWNSILFTNAFANKIENYAGPKRIVNTVYEPQESDKGVVVKSYLISIDDFGEERRCYRGASPYQWHQQLLSDLIDRSCNLLEKCSTKFSGKHSLLARSSFAYELVEKDDFPVVKKELDEIKDEPCFEKTGIVDSLYSELDSVKATAGNTDFYYTSQPRLKPRATIFWEEHWEGFFNPESIIVKSETQE